MKHITQSIIIGLVFIIVAQSCKQDVVKAPKLVDNNTEKSEAYYQEEHRNQYHFSPEANWMNDPNGMVYLDGEYHLFYQYYPDSTVWGPMHWAHAVSEDMVRWEHLPIALYPDSLGYIFSGSCVIDKDNTAGFGKDAMVAIYTYHDIDGERSGTSTTFQYQAIAYSTDKGRTFTKYEGNPVIPNPGIKDFRDPKVIWDDQSDQWVMVFAAHDQVKLYGSKNLKDWDHLSDWGKEYGEHGGVWECPDLFPIRVQDTDETKWVLLQSLNPAGPNGGSATQYFIGDFDGDKFILDDSFVDDVSNGKAVWLDYGKDNYAGVTWANVPESDGRTLFIGWMSNWQYAMVVPTDTWRSAMTIPRQLTLHKEDNEYRLRSNPVEELAILEQENQVFDQESFSGELSFGESDEPAKIELNFPKIKTGKAMISLTADTGELIEVGYDADKKSYFIDRTNAGKSDFNKDFAGMHYAPNEYQVDSHKMVLYVDVASIELFADDGRTVMTDIMFPKSKINNISVKSELLKGKPLKASIVRMKSAW